MATITQLENFEAAVTAIDPTLIVDTSDDGKCITLSLVAPLEVLSKYALTNMLTKLAHAHGLHFDGYDEEGHPEFLDEED